MEETEAPVLPLPENITCDVLVVGYGPVGMIFAALMAQYGLDVVVVERFPNRFKLPRAGHLDGETMRTFQRLGIAESVELIARPMLLWELVTADRDVLGSMTLGETGSGWKQDYLCYQPELETIIDARAQQLGVRVYMNTTAVQISTAPGRARAEVIQSHKPSAAHCTITASYIVGADGAGSSVRTAIGARRRDLGFRAMDHLVLDFEHYDPDRDYPQLPEVYQVLDINRPQLAGRWNGSSWSRWEFAAMEGETPQYLESDDTCWKLLATWGITPEDGTINRRAVYSFESTLTDRWRDGRILLMGDAAHTMPPFMGQGMLSGFRDAMNLSWKMAAVLAGDADDVLLDTYQLERSAHVEDIIQTSVAIGETVLITDPEKARARDELLRSGQGPKPALFPRLMTGIVRSPDAPDALNAGEGDGRPGLQARVAVGGRVDRMDNHFLQPGWRVISRHAVPASIFTPRQADLIRRLGIKFAHVTRGPSVDAYLDIDGEYDMWFRRTARKAFLQRPDHYIFGTARTIQDVPELINELAEALARSGWHDINTAGNPDPVSHVLGLTGLRRK